MSRALRIQYPGADWRDRVADITQKIRGTTLASVLYERAAGGESTKITRDSATLNLGYNTADQVAAATNGAIWVTYRHDASGRRTVSTNSAGTVRRLLVAPTPGTDLESPHLIANASGTVQQGYVYLGDDPILRYTTGGTASYYLEDGMGSVIGLAPASSPSTANTTRLFYDGFGNGRGTNGPAPTIPTGTGGDFRFHGAWLETDSGLYNMRAREYDARMGRFTSRDPVAGISETPETIHPYSFANNCALIYSDPDGKFTLIELSISSTESAGMQGLRAVSTHMVKKKLRKVFTNIIKDEIESAIRDLIPDFGVGNLATEAGNKFGRFIQDAFCDFLHVPDNLFFEVGLKRSGTPVDSGLSCNDRRGHPPSFSPNYPKGSIKRPDLIIGSQPPRSDVGGFPKTWLVAEFKGTTGIVYRTYAQKHPTNPGQLDACLNYAAKHTYSRTFLLVVGAKEKGVSMKQIKAIVGGKAALKGVLPLMVIIVGK